MTVLQNIINTFQFSNNFLARIIFCIAGVSTETKPKLINWHDSELRTFAAKNMTEFSIRS